MDARHTQRAGRSRTNGKKIRQEVREIEAVDFGQLLQGIANKKLTSQTRRNDLILANLRLMNEIQVLSKSVNELYSCSGVSWELFSQIRKSVETISYTQHGIAVAVGKAVEERE